MFLPFFLHPQDAERQDVSCFLSVRLLRPQQITCRMEHNTAYKCPNLITLPNFQMNKHLLKCKSLNGLIRILHRRTYK